MTTRRSGRRRSPAGEQARRPTTVRRGGADDGHVDADVRALIARGDVDGAATRAIRHFGPAVLQHLVSTLHDADDAADAFSGFEEHVWTGIGRFRGDASLRTWVFRIARNAANDVRRQVGRRDGRHARAVSEAGAEEAAMWPAARDPREDHVWLERLRQDLPADDRALLVLRVDRELPWSDIARALSPAGRRLDATTVIKRFERIAARLNRIARQRGLLR